MCGIAGLFMRESVPDCQILDILFSWSEKRGTDGFGIALVKRNQKKIHHFKTIGKYSTSIPQVAKFFDEHQLEVGDLILCISRAAPEQEPPSSERNMQPIYHESEKLVLVHNGAVSSKVYNQIKQEIGEDKYTSDIDSEAILMAYQLEGRNIKNAMERISGGVAALMYDGNKDCLYIINDFKPIAHGYIRGLGYLMASENDCLGEIVERYTNVNREGINVWENFYAHSLRGQRIKQIDLDSGFVQNFKYSPRYITQRWDSNYNSDGKKKF